MMMAGRRGRRGPRPGSVDGAPLAVLTLTPHEHVPLYRRGIAMAADVDPSRACWSACTGPGCTTTATAPSAWPSGSSARPSRRWWMSSWPSKRSFSSPWPSGPWAPAPQPRHDRPAGLVYLPAVAGLGPPLAAVRLPAGGGRGYRPTPPPGRDVRSVALSAPWRPVPQARPVSGGKGWGSRNRRARSRSRRASCRTGRTATPKRSWPPWRGPR